MNAHHQWCVALLLREYDTENHTENKQSNAKNLENKGYE